MEASKDFSDILRVAEFSHGIGNGILILQAKQWSQLGLVKFFNSNFHVLGQHKSKKDLLLAIEVGADFNLGLFGSLLPCQGWFCDTCARNRSARLFCFAVRSTLAWLWFDIYCYDN